ncbi:MAG TPA: urea amidolyase associated protein UAAP2 [Fibrobacteria bacterium]|nr:urea amidolyase associated protein UAAP2 [Fibrobacteria bacterium]
MTTLTESKLDPSDAVLDRVVDSGDHWLHPLAVGQHLRIVDLEGNQAVDTFFLDAEDPGDRYSAEVTVRSQGNLYLTTGSVLRSVRGNAMATIVADTCGRHDTVGGACAAESNQVRYAIEKRPMHSCRDSFLLALSRFGGDLSKRDIGANVNFFMNVPVTSEGALTFADGISGSGKYVEIRAERDILVLVSNCPQLNNPCNGWNPTPVRMLVWDPRRTSGARRPPED